MQLIGLDAGGTFTDTRGGAPAFLTAAKQKKLKKKKK